MSVLSISSLNPSAQPLQAALLQFNPTVGDMAGNARQIVEAARKAHADGAQLVVTPELALCGYPPEDLLLRPAFMRACDEALANIARQLADLPGLHLVVGHPQTWGGGDVRTRSFAVHKRLNAASVLHAGQVLGTYAKRELPNYQVFDERRYFVSGRDVGLAPLVVGYAGRAMAHHDRFDPHEPVFFSRHVFSGALGEPVGHPLGHLCGDTFVVVGAVVSIAVGGRRLGSGVVAHGLGCCHTHAVGIDRDPCPKRLVCRARHRVCGVGRVARALALACLVYQPGLGALERGVRARPGATHEAERPLCSDPGTSGFVLMHLVHDVAQGLFDLVDQDQAQVA